MIIVENACAKINLYLDVTQKRNDGYHDILSVMQTVSLCDKIELTETDSSEIVVKSSSAELPSDAKQNLVYRAADLFFKKIGKRAGGLLIEIPGEVLSAITYCELDISFSAFLLSAKSSMASAST